MAKVELILQAATKASHAQAIRLILDRLTAKSVLLSVAFVREAGVEALEGALRPMASKIVVFVGIRNGVTTIQGIKRLLAMKIRVYAVDTGSRDTIFHPKLYLVVNREEACLVIGSANLTFQGLHNNIEASALVSLDLKQDADREFVDGTVRVFDNLPRAHPKHVFLISDETHADELLDAGRLVDETLVPAPAGVGTVSKGERDPLPRMNLARVSRPRLRPHAFTKAVPRPGVAPTATSTSPAATPVLRARDYYLVWESRELTERDLNVPTGPRTARTGSMLFKKGAMQDIDQRHFFRDEIFSGLTWTKDPKKPHLERSAAMFEVVVKNLGYGKFRLRLTHNTKRNTKTYRQKNALTQVHWGDAKPVVARRDLLGRTMYLYRKDTTPPEFLVEID